MAAPALEIQGLQAWYGESHVLHGVDMVVQPGEVVTLLGRNGAGRTTTMRAVLGLTGARKGSIKVNGIDLIRFNADGKIQDFKVMVRPLKAINKVWDLMAAQLQAAQG